MGLADEPWRQGETESSATQGALCCKQRRSIFDLVGPFGRCVVELRNRIYVVKFVRERERHELVWVGAQARGRAGARARARERAGSERVQPGRGKLHKRSTLERTKCDEEYRSGTKHCDFGATCVQPGRGKLHKRSTFERTKCDEEYRSGTRQGGSECSLVEVSCEKK